MAQTVKKKTDKTTYKDADIGNSMAYSGIPRWLNGKESTFQCRRKDSMLGSRRSPGEGNGNGGVWQATVMGSQKVRHG